MAWYAITLDELLITQERYRTLKIEPGERATMLLDYLLEQLVTALGVDSSAPDSIDAQMAEMDIFIKELSPDEAPLIKEYLQQRDWAHSTGYAQVLGLYVFQGLEPKFFVPDPKINSEGKVTVEFYSFDKNVSIQVGSLRIPLR